jgi:hypothetical protein
VPITPLSIFKLPKTYMTTTEGDKILVLDLDSHKNVAGWSRLMIPFLISWEGQRQHRHKHIDIYIRSPENSTKYFALLIARVQMLFTFLSVPCVASNTLASLSSPSTNAWMDTGVTLQKRHFFLWASTPDCLTTVSRFSTEWKSSSLNRTLCGVIFQRENRERFWIKELRVLHPDGINRKQ